MTRVFDEEIPEKYRECEKFVRSTELKIEDLKREINQVNLQPVPTDPFVLSFLEKQGFDYAAEKSKVEASIKTKQREIKTLESIIEARKKCQNVNVAGRNKARYSVFEIC